MLAKTLYAYTIYSAALTPVILAAFYSRRANAYGAVSAIAAGTVVTFFWDIEVVKRNLPPLLAQRDAIFPALIAALVCLVVVSGLTAPPKASRWRCFFPRVRESGRRGFPPTDFAFCFG